MKRNLTDQEIKKIQGIQLEILMEVHRICTIYRIAYSIDGGTLLGAIRHGGFIPWDPDVDVIMLREDYERFYKAAQKDMDSSRFFLQEERTDKNYRWGFTKIRRVGTEFIREGQEHLKMHTGIFIDVLVMDNVPDRKIERAFYEFFCYCCRFVMWSEVGKKEEKNHLKRILYKWANRIPIDIVFQQLKEVREKYNRINTNLVRYMTCRYTYNKKLHGIKRSYFDHFKEYNFEGETVMGFEEYDSYLTTLYGNYMELPPIEQRKSHMPFSKIKLLDNEVIG